MNKTVFFVIVLIAAITLPGCKGKTTIEGLWVVQQVKMGDQEMTPNTRWMRFNADGTQQSGNGWFQHSVGTWSMDDQTKELTVVNTNGLLDTNGPFLVKLEKNTMTWTRTEEGDKVEVLMNRSEKLPLTYGDKILGLWKLEKAIGNYNYFSPNDTKTSTAYIFFRWDKRFVIQSAKGRINGVYNVHGHKPEVELIPYGDDLNRDFWHIDFDENGITLKLLNSEKPVIRNFKRIHEFPQ